MRKHRDPQSIRDIPLILDITLIEITEELISSTKVFGSHRKDGADHISVSRSHGHLRRVQICCSIDAEILLFIWSCLLDVAVFDFVDEEFLAYINELTMHNPGIELVIKHTVATK